MCPRDDDGAPLVEALIQDYSREAEFYHALLSLSREQAGLLRRDEDVGRYAALFPRKDELLRSIGRIELALEPLRRRWLAEPAQQGIRRRVNELLDGILLTIEAIRDQELRNEQLLVRRGVAARQALHRARVAAHFPSEPVLCPVACGG